MSALIDLGIAVLGFVVALLILLVLIRFAERPRRGGGFRF